MLGRPRVEDSAATADLRFSPSEVSLPLGADWLQDFWPDWEEDFATDPLFRCSAEGFPPGPLADEAGLRSARDTEGDAGVAEPTPRLFVLDMVTAEMEKHDGEREQCGERTPLPSPELGFDKTGKGGEGMRSEERRVGKEC